MAGKLGQLDDGLDFEILTFFVKFVILILVLFSGSTVLFQN
jgi:hypothetical protein